jgi:hypothetical protein
VRLFAVHDAEGKIYEAILSPSDQPTPVLETGVGLAFTELEPPEGLSQGAELREFIKHRATDSEAVPSVSFTDADGSSESADLQGFMTTYRVEVTSQQKSSAVRLDAAK